MNKKWVVWIIIAAAVIFIGYQSCSGDKAKCVTVTEADRWAETEEQAGIEVLRNQYPLEG